ncbi:MAG: hypothetical protein IIC73_07875 [Armatimonadetes bacterium]|nr:hypothetical protein [Armatimonadota bacterium]
MMRTIGAAGILALVMLAGCGQGTAEPGPTEDLGDREPLALGSNPGGSGRSQPPLADVDAHYDIPEPGTEGWDEASGDLAALGARIDDALANLEVGLAKAILTFETASEGQPETKDRMHFEPEIKIQDDRTFNITFVLPETKWSFNRLVGDGSRRAVRIEGKWSELPEFSGRRAPKMARGEVEAWPMTFPEGMFSFYFRGQDAWGPLFSAWQNGVAGYSATVERNMVRQGTVQREHYRVVAKTDEGNPTEVEVIIDSARMLPLTIRAIQTGPGGGESRIFWTASWAFGGTHKPKDFVIPVADPESPQT